MRVHALAVALVAGLSLGAMVLMVTQPPLEASSYDTAMAAALGQRLFLDPRLSPDGSIRCASCHIPSHAFSDGRPVSIGFSHRAGTRNTPSLLDVQSGEPRFWDGRRDQLEVAVLDPLVNAVEMGNRDVSGVIERLKGDPGYRQAFSKAFHEGDQSISAANLGAALATYIRSLRRPPDAYDRYQAGDVHALSPQAIAGLQLFTGKAECARCHDPAHGRFTDGQFHASGVGLGPATGHLAALTTQVLHSALQGAALGSVVGSNAKLAALGRFLVTHRATDVGAFRTPSLRNVALTAPYMHDGSISTLAGAIDEELYYRGLATGRPIVLTAHERADLLAFLLNLIPASQGTGRSAGDLYAPTPPTVFQAGAGESSTSSH